VLIAANLSAPAVKYEKKESLIVAPGIALKIAASDIYCAASSIPNRVSGNREYLFIESNVNSFY
jgi:hypothetical protein